MTVVPIFQIPCWFPGPIGPSCQILLIIMGTFVGNSARPNYFSSLYFWVWFPKITVFFNYPKNLPSIWTSEFSASLPEALKIRKPSISPCWSLVIQLNNRSLAPVCLHCSGRGLLHFLHIFMQFGWHSSNGVACGRLSVFIMKPVFFFFWVTFQRTNSYKRSNNAGSESNKSR